MLTPTPAPADSADSYGDCEGVLVIRNAAGSSQEATANHEGSGCYMPDSRADAPGCPEAAPQVAGNSLNPQATCQLLMMCL